MLIKFSLLLTVATLLVFGCKSEENFEDLGTNITSPIDVDVSDDGTHFYVLNSDFDRTYNAGSILTIDEEGKRVGAISTPRMGRAIKVAGDYMLAGFGRQDEDNAAKVQLYDVSTPSTPALLKTFEDLICNPVNFEMVKGYDHFGMVCSSGSVFIGTLPTNKDAPDTAKLKKIRRYSVIRRALYIDPVRELMLGFTTKFDKQNSKDSLYTDALTYSSEGEESAGSNEIPDEMEARRTARNNKGRRRSYQFFVYDIKAERDSAASNGCTVTEDEDCVFPERRSSDPVRLAEERFIYYKAKNFDGTPDLREDNPDQKYYRTNFHTAIADPDDPNSFYLSHRGIPSDKGSHANDVVKVTFTGDLRASDNVAPSTQDVFSFERVFGFKGTTSNTKYPGDIEIAKIGGQKILLVNNFRDLVTWKRSEVYFSIEAQSLDNNLWLAETTDNTDPNTSWYQIAVNANGKAMSISFYGHAAMLMEITPGVGIETKVRID